ncbi:protein of unknown function DUF21 [Gloeothece citriformis PCC 7424]|uniref:Hemolysin n=1 Tax=Gloeothece citriformis (strain PCC 7424) TaxID=65393 RepID=B7KGQ8_GLOC7|nr:hemolysin family protein [Gloeothece citriformis]ACK71985.1 protein of unknown function DUF21 [Gloeothece citriformis PCC 7424]
MTNIALEILIVLLLIIANGIFSGSEIAVVSSRKIRLEQMASRGDRKARAALKLANSPNDFLSTVQIGITLIGILSGAVGGATLAQRLEPLINYIPLLSPYSEGISVAIVVTIITYLSLVIGELIPKRIALNNPEQIARSVAKPMRTLSKFTAPLVHLLSFSTDNILKLLGFRASQEPSITEEEIRVLIKQATQSGMFEESEQEMVEGVFRLSDRPIKALMTPRFEIVWLNSEASLEEIQQQILASSHSRFLVARGTLDECLGFLRSSDFLSARLAGEAINLLEMIQPPLYIPENTKALKVLEQFKVSGIHIGVIIDEYGSIDGIVTLNDVMEAIVGDISTSENLEEPRIIQREDGSWLLDGLLSVDEIKNLFSKSSLPHEDSGHYHTLGGFVINFLGHIPHSGEHFQWEGLRFEVMDMDGTRVDKVMVSSVEIEPESSLEQIDHLDL